MPGADPHLSSLFLGEEFGSERLADLVRQVEDELDRTLGTNTTLLPEIAGRLGMSPRTLQRRLAEAGSDFSELLDRARRKRALAMIHSRAMSVSEVAHAIGYSDVRGFRAAFLRWTGHTPRSFRHARAR